MIKFRLLTTIILYLIVFTEIGGAVIEIRGATATDAASWNAQNFAGLWYDIETDKSTESIVIRGSVSYDRTIQPGNLLYYSSDTSTPYMVYSVKGITVDGQSSYNAVGWMGEKYLAVNGNANKLSRIVLEQEPGDTKVMAPGETWDMGGGYTLSAQSIDSKVGQAWFALSKDGIKLDDKVVLTGQVYSFRESLGGETNVPIFVTYVNNIYPGKTSDVVELKYSFLTSKTITIIQSGDKYGLLKVSTANENNIVMANEQSITLQKGSRIDLFGNIKLYVADNERLYYYPVRIEESDKYTIRGETAKGATSWNARNFAGFFYDLDSDQGTESLTLTSINNAGRYIESNSLTYRTSPVSLTYSVAAQKGIPVNNMNYYSVVGWHGDKYLAINGKANKLLRIIFEQRTSDKKTLTVGDTWDLGGGWTLTVNSIDTSTSPRQVWLTLSKDGVKKDDKIVTSGLTNANPLYTYFENNLGGETNVPVFVAYVDSIFAGATTDIVQLKYAFVASNSLNIINVGDRFGAFEVTTSNDNSIVLTNKDRISLSSGYVNLMGNLKFRIAGDTSNIRFYPLIEINSLSPTSIESETSSVSSSTVSSAYTSQYTYSAQGQSSNNQMNGVLVILAILILVIFFIFKSKKDMSKPEKKVDIKPVKPIKKEIKMEKSTIEVVPKKIETSYTLILEIKNGSNKTPIQKATIILDSFDGKTVRQISDIDGKVIFGKIKEGAYKLRIVSKEFEEYFRELEINKNDKIVIELSGKATLNISVFDVLNERPLAEAEIKIGEMNYITDEAGNVVIPDMAFGSYPLSVHKESYKIEELSLDVNEIKLNKKIYLNPEAKLNDELTVIGDGFKQSFNENMKKLSSSCDMCIPEYYRSVCNEMIRLIETIAATQVYADSDPSKDKIYNLYFVAERICKEMELILTNEENITEYINMEARGHRKMTLATVNIADYNQLIYLFMTDPKDFLDENKMNILKKLQLSDQEITDNVQKYNVSPLANLWLVSQKIIKIETKDEAKEAASLLLGNILLDKTRDMFKNEEIIKRIKK